jgi:pentatricopeptide repeat protein
MPTKTQSESYTKGLQLAEQGDYQESLVCFQRHLEDQPKDAEAISDAGTVLFCMGETDRSIEHFKKAIAADSAYGQSYWNLAEAYLEDNKVHQAVEYFDEMQRLGILSPEQTIRAANMLLEQSDNGAAIEMMLKSAELSDSVEIVKPMIDVVKSKRPKIAFFDFSENDSFYKYASQRFMTAILSPEKSEQLPDIINWCDIAWFAGSGENIHRALALPKVCKIVLGSDGKESTLSADNDMIDEVVKDSCGSDCVALNNVLLELEKTITKS